MDLEFWIIGSFGQTERETKGTKIPPVRRHSGNIRKTRNLSLLSVTGEGTLVVPSQKAQLYVKRSAKRLILGCATRPRWIRRYQSAPITTS